MTSIKRLIDKLLDNWLAKVVSLIIAIILYIFYQASQIDKKTIVVPLKIVEDGLVMHVGSVPNSVAVTIRSNDTIMNMVNPSDFESILDISYITEPGTYTLPVHINLSSKLMELDPLEVILKDEEITLKVDRRITKYVPLQPSVVGEVAHGYSISQISINPSTVEISGPETLVNSIDVIPTSRIMVSNAETNFSVETGVQEQNKLISIKDSGPFTATVSLTTQIMEKVFTDITIDSYGLAPNLILKNNLPSVSITLSGDVPSLEKYNPNGRIASINLKDYTEAGSYEVPVRYSVNPAFSIVSKSLESVTVLLEALPEENPAESENPADSEGEAEPAESAENGAAE